MMVMLRMQANLNCRLHDNEDPTGHRNRCDSCLQGEKEHNWPEREPGNFRKNVNIYGPINS